jgi:hypothetical protein
MVNKTIEARSLEKLSSALYYFFLSSLNRIRIAQQILGVTPYKPITILNTGNGGQRLGAITMASLPLLP